MRSSLPVLILLCACDAGAEPNTALPPAVQTQSAVSANSTVTEMAATPATGGIGCSVEEVPIFACNLENGNRVAVCGLGEYVGEYRYGNSKPELTITGGEFANVMYSGGGESQIAFTNAGYRYVVFARMVRTNFTAGEPNYPAMSDGIIVLRGESFVEMQLCDGPTSKGLNVNAANAMWERQEELFTLETIRADH